MSVQETYYSDFFTHDSYWSTRYPNRNESLRLGKICEYLSEIVCQRGNGRTQQPRILDLGCGRGWLTYFASVYGCCEGIDPVPEVIDLARQYFPEPKFYVGTAEDLLAHPRFSPYDIVITSEVIEHILDEEKDSFVCQIKKLLAPNGYVIITTPRGELFQKWLHLKYRQQPIEAWLTERELRNLMKRHGFIPILHDRVYVKLSRMSTLHRVCASSKFFGVLNTVGLSWVNKGLQYLAGFYQVWLFQLSETSTG